MDTGRKNGKEFCSCKGKETSGISQKGFAFKVGHFTRSALGSRVTLSNYDTLC